MKRVNYYLNYKNFKYNNKINITSSFIVYNIIKYLDTILDIVVFGSNIFSDNLT